jgi:hypothetical protein
LYSCSCFVVWLPRFALSWRLILAMTCRLLCALNNNAYGVFWLINTIFSGIFPLDIQYVFSYTEA